MQTDTGQGAGTRPASAPATNALRGGGANGVMTGVGTLAATWIYRKTDLSLEESALAVAAMATLLGSAMSFGGAFARDLLHQDQALPADSPQRMSIRRRTIWRALGGMLG